MKRGEGEGGEGGFSSCKMAPEEHRTKPEFLSSVLLTGEIVCDGDNINTSSGSAERKYFHLMAEMEKKLCLDKFLEWWFLNGRLHPSLVTTKTNSFSRHVNFKSMNLPPGGGQFSYVSIAVT